MHFPIVSGLFLVGFASAATTTSLFCASARNCPKSATSFCSSYLHIPAKTTTVTPTVTVTRTSTLKSGITTTTAYTSTSTWTFTSEYADFDTTTTTLATYTTTSYSCTFNYYGGVCTFTGNDPNAPQKRALTTPSSPRPSCLKTYSSGTALSSACKCLSIPTTTSTVSKGPTVTKTVVKTVTKAKSTTTAKTYATAYTTTTKILTQTLTETTYASTVTASVTGNAGTSYLLVSGSAGSPSGEASNFVTDANGDTGVQFSQPYGPHADTFYLGYYEETPCVLSNGGGSAPYAYIGATGDMIEFTSDAVPADQLVVCRQSSDTNQMFCKHPKGTTYNAGYVDADQFWHIPINSSAATAYIFADTMSGGYGCSS